MRSFQGQIALDLQGAQWSLLVASLRHSRGDYMNRVLEAKQAGNEFGVAAWSTTVRETSEMLAVLDPKGEHEEVEAEERTAQCVRERNGEHDE